MIEQIKQALEKATPDWYNNGNEIVSRQNLHCGIGGFLTEDDNHLASNAPEWLRYLIGEVERLSKCQSCGGVGYVELSHDPYMTSPCECVVFEQVIEDYPKLKLRNEELQKALEYTRIGIGNGWELGYLKETGECDLQKMLDRINNALKEGETK